MLRDSVHTCTSAVVSRYTVIASCVSACLTCQRPLPHIQVAKDSNGNAKITNMHLLRSESPKPSLRLLVTITDSRGPGRIESREVEPRRSVEDAVTLEATDVDPGRSSEYGSSEVIVFTSAEQGSGLKGVLHCSNTLSILLIGMIVVLLCVLVLGNTAGPRNMPFTDYVQPHDLHMACTAHPHGYRVQCQDPMYPPESLHNSLVAT